MATVCFLLFIMGVRVGLNEEIMGAIKSTGVISAILFVFGTGLSVILTWLFTKYVIDGRRANATAVSKGENAAVPEGANAAAVPDTTLPIILKAEGNGIMPAVLYFGIVINIVVPFLLTLITL